MLRAGDKEMLIKASKVATSSDGTFVEVHRPGNGQRK